MFSHGKTVVDHVAGAGPILLSFASWAGAITPILTAISAVMAITWFGLRFYHYARHGRDIPK